MLARRLRAIVGLVALVAIVAGWFLIFRPVGLGGPASYVIVSGSSMEPLLHDGDVVVLQRASDYRRGDTIAYSIPKGQPAAGSLVIHRIVGGDAKSGFIVKGDNKPTPDPWRPKGTDIVGRSWIELPGAAEWILILRRPIVVGALAAGLAAFWFFLRGADARRARVESEGEAT